MKQTIRLFFIIMVSLLLSSCDAFVSLSSAMGKNIIGFNKEEADLIVDTLTVESPDESEDITITKGEIIGGIEFEAGKKFRYTDSDGETRDLIILGKGTENYSVIAWGKWAVRVAKADDDNLDLSKVEDILVPSDLTILSALLSSSAGDYVLSRLSEKVEDENTLEAARGTIKTLDAVLNFISILSFIPNEKAKAICEYASDLRVKIERNNDITWGDVVVLDVITNLCAKAPEEIMKFLKESEKAETEIESVSKMLNELLDDMYDFLFEAVEILNRVSGTTGVFRGTSITKLISACFMK